MKRFISIAILTALFSASVPLAASAASVFYGLVSHVSVSNIKVYDPRSHQTLSFLILPKFDQVFSEDGKTTYQMRDIHDGQYVRVIYDQKALGVRHADKIVLMH
ncbi:MAG: hypothetical protein ACYCX6_12210 [Vulcanimicrobiaceae bacterium]